MAVLPIYNSFNPALKQQAKPIKEITNEIKNLAKDMFDTLRNTENGVGLAANQVGKDVAMIVLDLSEVDEYKESSFGELVLINPKITDFSDETDFYNEGCLSVPGFYDDLERSISITLQYTDLKGKEIIQECTGFFARVVQHEIDHLNGILFYEKLTAFRRTLNKGKLRKIQAGEYEIHYDMMDAENNLQEA
jgi:peptide deformylase